MWNDLKIRLEECIYREDVRLLFDYKEGNEIFLNQTGADFVSQIMAGSSGDELAQYASEKYGIDYKLAYDDIMEFSMYLSSILKEKHKFKQLEKSVDTTRMQFPLSIELELTSLCNMKCSFCYNLWRNSTAKDADKCNYLPKDVVLNILKQAKEGKALFVRYSGGEPTLYPDFDEILSVGASYGLAQIIFTNGLLLNSSTAKAWKNNHVYEVLLSLHGSKETHDRLTRTLGSYDAVMDAISFCNEQELRTVVEMTVTAENYDDIANVLIMLKRKNVKKIALMRYVPTGKEDEKFIVTNEQMINLINLLEENNSFGMEVYFPCSQKHCLIDDVDSGLSADLLSLREKYLLQSCKAGISWFSISHSGDLRICPHSNTHFGNILNDPSLNLVDIWGNAIKPHALNIVNSRKTKCSKCLSFSKCMGGCFL